MAHVRKQIRDAVALLVTGLDTTKANVYVSRTYPVDLSALDEKSALLIYTLTEQSERHAMGVALVRLVSVAVQGLAQINDTIDDTLDEIAAEVEAALGGSDLNGLVDEFVLTASEFSIVGEGAEEAGSVRMTWTARYYTDETDAETALA